MGVVKEFKDFISRGNVIDLAVGIIIGGGFQKIVSSLVADIIMPPIGLLIGGVNFTDLKFRLKPAELNDAGKVIKEAVDINYGQFFQASFDFLIIAVAVFLLVKAINTFHRKKAEEETPPKEALNGQELLLTEIRDILQQRDTHVRDK